MTAASSAHPLGSDKLIRPGVVAGAVLRAARTSARTTGSCLAAAVGVAEDEIRAWEAGVRPLAEVPFPLLERLAATLASAGATSSLVADLTAAAWCDLVITGVGRAEDVTCLLADLVVGEAGFHGLLAWALAGEVPDCYSRFAEPGPLVDDPNLAAQVRNVLKEAGC